MGGVILTPDQRLRVFVSSTMEELAEERRAARRAVEQLHLAPVMFELGARPHPPRSLYLAYLRQSHVFVGLYWQRYGWVAPGMDVSGLEDELWHASGMARLVYLKAPAPDLVLGWRGCSMPSGRPVTCRTRGFAPLTSFKNCSPPTSPCC
jgi:hypothetical protein